MTKEEFLNGDIFFSSNDLIEEYKFTKDVITSEQALGYISVKKRGCDSFVYYANIIKLNKSSVSIYFFGLQKMHKETVKLKFLKKRLPL